MFCLAVVASISSGCIYASLASTTGPCPPGHQWSMDRRQIVHVGEDVEFDFVLLGTFRKFIHPLGIADYCVTNWGSERVEVEPDAYGHFRFSLPFDIARPGQKIKATTAAYRMRGGRDFMRIGGEWVQSDSPYEIADKKVASDSIVFSVYEAPIELKVVRPPDDLDPETGVMRIRRADASMVSVYVDKPNRPGFTLSDPGPDGYYRVVYRPTGNDLNPTGTTDVDFTVYDVSGQPHHASATIETP